jgi:hypothetical protein
MRKAVVDRSLVRWQRLVLVLGVLVAAWGPAHSDEVPAIDHGVVAHSDPAPGGDGDPRCGHRDVERDVTQATSVRLAQPDVVSGLPAEAPVGEEPRPALADLGGPRASSGPALRVVVCVWRQ